MDLIGSYFEDPSAPSTDATLPLPGLYHGPSPSTKIWLSSSTGKPEFMRIAIIYPGVIPPVLYGGTERVIWSLGLELVKMGHHVTFVVNAGSACPFANIKIIDPTRPIASQLPPELDISHFHYDPDFTVRAPYLVTMHGNRYDSRPFDHNTVFVSRQHAMRHGSSSYVHNGLAWEGYSKPQLRTPPDDYFHFLAKAAWRVKNLSGAIRVIKRTSSSRLMVMGGNRLNFNMGFRLTLSRRASFFGMVSGARKLELLNNSRGLLFPVIWHEPFGLAVIESLYMGCPVFGTPYGALPEIVSDSVGFLSDQGLELAAALEHSGSFDRRACHEYAADTFSARQMAIKYVNLYELILQGTPLNAKRPQLIPAFRQRILPFKG